MSNAEKKSTSILLVVLTFPTAYLKCLAISWNIATELYHRYSQLNVSEPRPIISLFELILQTHMQRKSLTMVTE
jgi:hypothetical protein